MIETLDPYAAIERKTLERCIPFKVDWELTWRCNERCRHCYQSPSGKEQELSLAEVQGILDQLAAMGCLYLTLTGGEILLRDDFFAIAEYARHKGFALRLFTNGTLIDAGTADRLAALCPLSVEISLYAMQAGVHDRMTGVAGSWGRTTRAFELLKQRHIPLVLKSTVTRETVDEVASLRAYAGRMGAGFSFSFTVIPRVNGTGDVLDLRLQEEQLRAALRTDPAFTQGIGLGGVPNYKPLCAAGFNSLYIGPAGEVFPCVCVREFCGSLRDTPLAEIWQAEVFERLRKIRFEDLKQCLECPTASYCDRCMGLALMETGNLYGVSPHDCTLARVRKEIVEGAQRR